MQTSFWDYEDKVVYSKEKANKVVLHEGLHARTTLWCLLPGQHIHSHVHAGDHVWVVLEGDGLFLSETESRKVTSGTILHAPAGEPHGIENSADSGLVFVSISAG